MTDDLLKEIDALTMDGQPSGSNLASQATESAKKANFTYD
jgi:hypothetical protein